MIEVSFCTEQQLVETVTLFREHPVGATGSNRWEGGCGKALHSKHKETQGKRVRVRLGLIGYL